MLGRRSGARKAVMGVVECRSGCSVSMTSRFLVSAAMCCVIWACSLGAGVAVVSAAIKVVASRGGRSVSNDM